MLIVNAPLTVFNGRANKIDLGLTQGGVPVDTAFVTGVAVRVFTRKYGTLVRYIEGRSTVMPNESQLFDTNSTAVVPGAGPNPIGILSMTLGLADPPIPANNAYWCDLIIFSAAKPQGESWAQFFVAVIGEAPET